MLESAGFDFRNRHPQRYVIKLIRECRLNEATVGKTAYNMCIDIYRTFAPLKQTAPTLAIACIELSARIHNADLTAILGESGVDYRKWSTSREEIMGTTIFCYQFFTVNSKINNMSRNPPRFTGPLHASSEIDNRRPGTPHGLLHQHTHNP